MQENTQISTTEVDSTVSPQVVRRDPHKIYWGSSYDRGLSHLLEMWPDIKNEVPDATLSICYGWDLFLKIMANNPERMAWHDKMNKLMEQPGITHLGKISHEAVRTLIESCGVHAYPTHFGEISCITCMKTQAWGAIPCVISYAALEETVQYGVKVEGDIYEPEVYDKFKQELIALLKDESRQEKIRKEMMPWARDKFAWSKVAKQWDGEFRSKPSLDKQVEELMDNNQALDAWNLVKDTDYPKKDRVYLKVKHAFDPEVYKNYYQKDLIENPVPEDIALDCQRLAPRFGWLQSQLEQQKPKTLLDLGCADGYLCLTQASRGIKCIGYNLFKPSVDLATKRAKDHGLDCQFICDDLFNAKGKFDAVVLFEVLEHLPDPKKAIKHCLSLLSPKGSLYISTPSPDHVGIKQHKEEPNHEGWDDGKPSGHLKLYSETELKDLLKDISVKQISLDQDKCWLIEVTNG